jgi:hypothetical protein
VNSQATSTGAELELTATCPAGKSVIGGGFVLSDNAWFVNDSSASSPSSWTVTARRGFTRADTDLTVQAICAAVALP